MADCILLTLLEILPIQIFAVRFVGFFSSGKLSKSTKRDGILFDVMKLIPLTKGKFAMVDDEDFERLNKFKWHYSYQGYAVCELPRVGNKRQVISMHREVMGLKQGEECDHRDTNKINNTRVNLRPCTRSQNVCNVPLKKNNTTGFKGVYYRKDTNKYCARIKYGSIKIVIGCFTSLEEAGLAYQKTATELHGEFARW